MRRILILLLCSLSVFAGRAQRLDPADYVFPIQGVAGLYAANFGELRPGHFHAGVDIKTDGAEGKRLIAVADGYVSRVTITPGGYGRAVYLTLRNGTTAVYGHLQRFRNDIERHVEEERLHRRANRVDLHFGPETWPVRQGDEIGRSGNSGSSMGPHLHFELRDTPTQRRLNIVRQGVIRPADDLPPRIMRLHYIEVDSLEGVCVESRRTEYAVLRTAEGRYRLARQEPVPAGRKGYFVAEVTDRRNGIHNTFGVWRVTAYIDDERYFEYRMDGFMPAEARCCDAVSCYPVQLSTRNEAIRLVQGAGSPDCFYPAAAERGLVRTRPGQIRRIRVEAEDDTGNTSHLEFDIRGRAGEFRARVDSGALALHPRRAATVCAGREAEVRIPAGALFESIFCRPERLETPPAPEGVAVLSPAYRLLGTETPLRNAAEYSIRVEILQRLQLRAALARIDHKGRLVYVGGTCSSGSVTARTRSTGPMLAVADTLPPVVEPLFAADANLSQTGSLRFRTGDNFAGIASCSLMVDGEWVPCDRYPMQGRLEHRFGEPAVGRRHTYRLTVTDACGNSTHREGTFYR